VSPILAVASVKTMATDKFMVYYRSGMEDEALHALQVLEHYRPRLEQMVGNDYPRAAIKLEDMGNLVNGFANPVGNVIGLYMYPPTSDELAFGEDWFQIVASHEYIHQLQLSHESGLPAILRTLFGNILYVQLHQPMWMTEGITVYGESKLSEHAGRMNSGYYSAIISALARENKLPSPTKASYYSSDTPLAHYYVFGGSFHRFLAERFGEDKFTDLYRDNSSRIAAYTNGVTPALALDPAFRNAYGMSLDSLWALWQADEKAKLKPLQREQITTDGWRKSDLSYHNGSLYYTRNIGSKTGPGSTFSHNSLMRLDVNSPGSKPVEILRQATDFPAGYQILGNEVFYSRNEYRKGFANKENDGYGAVTQLLRKSGMNSDLLYEGQVRAFLAIANGRILIAEDTPLYRGSVLFEYDPVSQSKKTLYQGEELIHGICELNGEIYLNAKPHWSNSGIFMLENGRLTTVVNSPSTETLLYAREGKLIYNAVFNDELRGFEMDLKSRKVREYGSSDYLNSPVLTDSGELYYLGLNAQGADLYSTSPNYVEPNIPVFKRAPAPFSKASFGSQSALEDGTPIHHGDYSPNIGHLLNPRMLRLPQIYGTADSLAVGAILVGADAVGDFPQWQIAAVYDTFRKKVIGDFMLSSRLLNPVNQELVVSTDDDLTIVLNQSVSLLRRQNYGLNSFNLGLGLKTWQDFGRKQAYPFISQGFSWSTGQAGIRNIMFWESTDLNLSDRDRLGWQGQLSLRQKLPINAELNSILNLGYDPDAPSDEVFYPIRGYDGELLANKGLTLRNTVYFPLLKIRSGVWNPQMYVEDVHLGFFYDLAKPEENLSYLEHYSYGAGLIGEFGLAFMGTMNAGVRAGKTKEGKNFAELILGMDF
jgi:hypothetical protein